MSENKIYLGAHTSTAGGVHNALIHGKSIGANCVQMFTTNQRRWEGRTFTPQELELWQKTLDDTGLEKIMSHDSYLINLGAYDEEILVKSRKAFLEEVTRCVQLNLAFLNFHPGAYKCYTEEECLDRIAESILLAEPLLEGRELRLLLEATAGQGTSIGHRFEHLKYILEKVRHKIKVGVCIDTCHIFVAGYDIRTPEAWDRTLNEFDQIVGLSNLYAFHLNDSIKGLGSRVDRHRPIGQGEIGLESFKFIMKDPRTKFIPKYLETPETERWPEEIKMLLEFASS